MEGEDDGDSVGDGGTEDYAASWQPLTFGPDHWERGDE